MYTEKCDRYGVCTFNWIIWFDSKKFGMYIITN